MKIKDLRDIVAQIDAACPTEDTEFPVLLEGRQGFLQITFMSHDDIKIQLHYRCDSEEDWAVIAYFYELSDLVGQFGKQHVDEARVSITPMDGTLTVECNKTKYNLGRAVESMTEDFELLFFNEEEFEAYHTCRVLGDEWSHLKAAAFIARQNTVKKKAKYPALCGINLSGVTNNLEISAMCPTATTYRLIWQKDPYWQNFSFTIPVELIDQINKSIDPSWFNSVEFEISPELVKATLCSVSIDKGKTPENNSRTIKRVVRFLVAPIKGRYFYPKVPINQVTEKSVEVGTWLLKEALTNAIKGSSQPHSNEVLLQIQDEQLFVHGLSSSFQIDAADCIGIADNEVRVCAVQLLDMLKHMDVRSAIVFLDFPDKITQALMISTCSGIQYLLFSLVKGDRILSPKLDVTETLLTIPGVSPGEPDLILELAEQSVLNPPKSEAQAIIDKEELIQEYGLLEKEEGEFTVAINKMCDQLIEARRIVEDTLDSEVMPLVKLLKETLDDHEYKLDEYESDDPGDLYYHGGLCKKDLNTEIDAINDLADSVKVIAGRVQESSLKLEKTYSVRIRFF